MNYKKKKREKKFRFKRLFKKLKTRNTVEELGGIFSKGRFMSNFKTKNKEVRFKKKLASFVSKDC